MDLVGYPPRFSSTIRFVQQPEFAQLEKLPRTSMYLPGKAFDFEMAPDNLSTDTVIMCNAGGIQNGRLGMMFHIYPDTERPTIANRNSLERIRSVLTACNDLFGEGGQKVTGILLGGASRFPESREYFEHLHTCLQNLQIPFSLFWGHRNKHISGMHYSVPQDTWSIRVHGDNMEPAYPRTLEEVRKYYEHVSIAPGDTLVLENERVTSEGSKPVK